MRVVQLISHKQDTMCGVMDYTKQLVQALKAEQTTEVSIYRLETWSLKALWDLRKKYKNQNDVIFHVQYPSVGMGLSPAPFLLPIFFSKNKVFITLHEFSSFNLFRKLYALVFEVFRKKIIFTNEPERLQYEKFFPWAKANHAIIPIGNNIDVVQAETAQNQAPRLIYFGQIVKNKGIEEFIETVKLLRQRGSTIPCVIMGALIDKELNQQISSAAKEFEIECLYNLSAEEVSRELSRSSIALLLFEGGVSDKRGSAIACLKHGVAVITRHSDLTSDWWKIATYSANRIEDSVSLIEDITTGKKDRIPDPVILKDALQHREWDHIARKHMDLYESRQTH